MQISDLLDYKHWLVAGDVLNPDKYAYKIADRLSKAGYEVTRVNPRDKSGTIATEIAAINESADVLDLVINPIQGIDLLRQAHQKGISKVLAQPGAESQEIRAYCQQHGIDYFEGCVLQELNKKGL